MAMLNNQMVNGRFSIRLLDSITFPWVLQIPEASASVYITGYNLAEVEDAEKDLKRTGRGSWCQLCFRFSLLILFSPWVFDAFCINMTAVHGSVVYVHQECSY